MTLFARTLRAALVAVAVLASCFSAAAQPEAELWARDDYPIPPEGPTRVFFLQRSSNSNTVVYEARLRADGMIDPERPIEVYWLRYNTTGERKALSFVERSLAYGALAERERPGAWTIQIVGFPDRPARLMLDAAHRPVLIGEIAGRPARLVSGYLHVDDSGLLPRVLAIDLYGKDPGTGARLHERFVP